MLNLLHIENIALIERADIEFTSGLNVLTGETGAGKSIIIDSIGLLMGAKSSKEIIRHGADFAVVSGAFDSRTASVWLADNGIEADDELVIRRKIVSDGKNSCRVNGNPVTVAQLRELSAYLIDIHGQNDGQAILDERTHLSLLDRFGDYSALIEKYHSLYSEHVRIEKEIERLSMDDIEKARLYDSLTYQIKELKEADIHPGEYDTISERRDLLRNSEKLTEAVDESLSCLDGDEELSAETLLQNSSYLIQKASSYSSELEPILKKINEAAFLISDAVENLTDFRDSLDFSAEEYDSLERRISSLNKLMRKYSKDEQGLLDYLGECEKKLDLIQYSDDMLLKLNKQCEENRQACLTAAEKLTLARKDTAEVLQGRICAELRELNMPSVSFEVEFIPVSDSSGFNSNGDHDLRFIMSANAGEKAGRISRIASGGELSRIMLAIKNVFAEKDVVPTLIFDEIDTGVSGIAGQKVSEKLYRVSKNKQVMCVTHLPQIAAMADHQYEIEKHESGGRTYTFVSELDLNGRKKDLARLYGGDNITELTLKNAEEQLNVAIAFKNSLISEEQNGY